METIHTDTTDGEAPVHFDVWSRTSRKYRVRAVLMLLVLVVLFAGLCCFTYWLRTGDYWPWSSDDYPRLMSDSFRPTGDKQITLRDFLTAPISVKDVPVHGIIMGLLLATLTSIPPLVAILYRFPSSVAFPMMVALLAAMPWLGITIFLGCVLMSLRPFRFSFRYASVLIGLIPIAIYFITASLEPAGTKQVLVQDQALLYAPWVLAVLGSCVICAIALAIAKIINYRPGGISPLMAVLFAIPVILFHTQVGVDELEYRLLEQKVGPASRTFTPIDINKLIEHALRPAGDSMSPLPHEEVDYRPLRRVWASFLEKTENDRLQAIFLCDNFLRHHPKSRYVPNVLFLKGRALDLWVILGRDNHVEFRSDLPHLTSRTTWETLVEKFPRSAVSATAYYRLAILSIREGQLDKALTLLQRLDRQFENPSATTQAGDAENREASSMFHRTPASLSLGMDISQIAQFGHRLREMLEACRSDPRQPVQNLFANTGNADGEMLHPLQLLLSFDENHLNYRANLEALARLFPNSETSDYVELRLARLESSRTRRIQRYANAVENLKGRPSEAEALYYFADSLQEDSLHDESRQVFEKLTKNYPESCWTEDANKRLAKLPMQPSMSR